MAPRKGKKKKKRRFPVEDHFDRPHLLKEHPLWAASVYGPYGSQLPWYEEEFVSTVDRFCSHCNRKMNAHAYPFRNAWCRSIIDLFAFRDDKGGFEWTHTEFFVVKPEKLSGIKLPGWLVIEGPRPVPKGSSNPSSGIYRLTKIGEMFIKGQCTIPKKLVQYKGKNIALCGPPVTFAQCWGQNFNYRRDVLGEEE